MHSQKSQWDNYDLIPAVAAVTTTSVFYWFEDSLNFDDFPSAGFLTYKKKYGYTVFMSSDYEFGLTAQTGYCK